MTDHDELYRTDPEYRRFYDRMTGRPATIPGVPLWLHVVAALVVVALCYWFVFVR